MAFTGRAVFAAAAGTAALAGLLFGFDTAVISGVTQAVAAHFALDQVALGTTVSAALWGTLLGAMTAGVPGDRFGARAVLRVLAAFYVLSGLGSALAWDWGSLLVFRFIGGLAIGGSSVLAPVYIAEIAPAARRGLLVGMFQLAIVVGILAAYISNAAVGSLAIGNPSPGSGGNAHRHTITVRVTAARKSTGQVIVTQGRGPVRSIVGTM